MAFCYVTEYAALSVIAGRTGQMPQEPPLASQVVAIGVSSAQSAAFNAKTKFVRIHVDAIAGVEVGANPTAAVQSAGVGSQRFAAGQTEFKDVSLLPAGKVAVIATT